jgi:hypothetical protein
MKKYTIRLLTLTIIFFYSITVSNGQDLEFAASKAQNQNVQAKKMIQIDNKQFYQKTEVLDAETVEINFFDTNDRLAIKKYHDSNGDLYYDEKGVAVYAYEYDERNNITSIKYYDEFETLYRIDDVGPAMVEMEYDNKDRVTKVLYYDIDGSLFLKNGTPIIEYSYNENNEVSEKRIFLSDKVFIDYAAAIIRYEYDDKGRIIEQTCFNKYAQPTTTLNDKEDKEDFSKIIIKYSGDEASPTFYNLEGEEVKPY